MSDSSPIMNEYQRNQQEAIKRRNEIWEKANDVLVKFYYQITLLSSGAIALSITYLGYLQSNPAREIKIIGVLITAWACFIMSIIMSLGRNYHYGRFMHYSGSAAWFESMRINRAMLESHMKGIKPSSEDVANVLSNVEEKEKSSERYFRLSEPITHILFIVALLLLTLFAICNTLIK